MGLWILIIRCRARHGMGSLLVGDGLREGSIGAGDGTIGGEKIGEIFFGPLKIGTDGFFSRF